MKTTYQGRIEAEQFMLFSVESPPAPARPLEVELLIPRHPRRLCPIVASGAPIGGTGDLATLVIDGTGTTDKEAVIQ